MLEIIVYGAIAAFVGIAICGHILVFHAIFGKAGQATGKGERLPAAKYSSSQI